MPHTLIAGQLKRSGVLKENSGLARLRNPANAGLLVGHNDSGGLPEVYVIDHQAKVLNTTKVDTARAIDWEDISVGPGPDPGPYVYVSDSGDNGLRRRPTQLYRFPEPEDARTASRVIGERIDVTYSKDDEPVCIDCEAFAISTGGDGVWLSKRMTGPGGHRRADVYVARGLAKARVTVEAACVGSVQVPANVGPIGPTGLDISGRVVAVRVLQGLLIWRRRAGESSVQALTSRPADVVVPGGWGEAVAVNDDDASLWCLSEGAGAALTLTLVDG